MSGNLTRRTEALEKLESELTSRERKAKRRPITTVAASGLAVVALAGGIVYAATRGGDDQPVEAQDTSTEATTTEQAPGFEPIALERAEALPETVSCEYTETGEDANGATVPEGKDVPTTGEVGVTLKTNQGEIPMTLDRSVSPCAVNAIEHLATEDYFDDTVCHRLTTEGIYVLQCGDPTGSGAGGPGFKFANEYPTDEADDLNTPRLYPRGTLAMANAGVDTNGSQFFLNYKDSPLPPNYTYFGTITDEGLSTLDAIAEKGVTGGAGDGQPAEQVVIEDAVVS